MSVGGDGWGEFGRGQDGVSVGAGDWVYTCVRIYAYIWGLSSKQLILIHKILCIPLYYTAIRVHMAYSSLWVYRVQCVYEGHFSDCSSLPAAGLKREARAP